MESQARGGTRWRRFGLVMVPSVAATAAIGVALSQGALAASFAVSGQQFKVSVDKLDGDGFVQYGAMVTPAGGEERPVAVSAFDHATINNLCQSVVLPVPFFGDVTVKIGAGSDPDNPVEADNLFIDLEQLNADAEFRNIDIGVAADQTTKGPTPEAGTLPGSFAQQADGAVLTDVRQTAWATSAGTFKLSDLDLSLHRGANECF
ncbi:hypothetical protein SAMN06297387_101571 [Streptomyces zhaozhouensis]|jgi:hypothetical protein|uniref:Cholesterol esterase n=1 Tax=Streptomyces zhaozhouensis TaxID=1300267 RepID=A0A286DKW5_9ACTN|nr:DUF6230 family protein [Streptomyces zhaozhouensis]SOD59279.1 hypothetical protein SAMN06297387_101571 [Streptomyces zhaozhouensis]